MKPTGALVWATLAVAAAILAHGWLSWLGHRYSFRVLDDNSVIRMNTQTGDFAVCTLRGAFLSGDRTIQCAPEVPARE
ncbi:MAG: hypothetical protein AAGB05_10715 [Pseudomonadota bacterium]